MQLVRPSLEYLPSFVSALERGWCDNAHRPAARLEQLAQAAEDPAGFIASLNDASAQNRTITLPDGSIVPRLPGIARWMWDGEFAGAIYLRWQPGTCALPEYCLGHVGYSVVPWKRRRGYATQALAEIRSEARAAGLAFVELVTTAENAGSQAVITSNGGFLSERFDMPASQGGGQALRFRILL